MIRLLMSRLPRVALLAATLSAPLAAQARTKADPKPPVLDSLATEPAQRQSWTADRARLGVGDIITVLVDQRTLANANLRDVAADRRNKTLGLDVKPPAAPGAPAAGMKATVDFDQNGDSRRTGELVRGTQFRSSVSARVVAISPSGLVRIQGRTVLDMDKNKQDITLSGWVRPEDLMAGTNTVESSRIADASITFTQQGGLGSPKVGFLSRVLGVIWP